MISTRGGINRATFQEAVTSGLAPDGGLYVPETIPSVSREELQSWSALKYPQLAEKVIRLFVSEEEIPSTDLSDILKDCFSSFQHPDVLSIRQIGPHNILEMWHGPTGAFKDLAFVLFAQLINYFFKKQGKKGIALIGTLGDTGCSAIQAFKNATNVSTICLYPKHSISKLQRLQTTTTNSPNVLVFSCDTDSDEFDSVLMKVLADDKFAKEHNLTWVNSINVGRIICHTVHHIFTYLLMCPSCDQTVTFYIPSGALADSSSAYLAHCMGVPIKIVSVVNENDFFHNFFNSKSLIRPLRVVKTYSCAMDTVFPHNVERILYLLSKCDTSLVKRIMDKYYSTGRANVPDSLLEMATGSISSQKITQDKSFATAKYIWDTYQYVICPHTSLAVSAHEMFPVDGLSVCLATATPAKFREFLIHLDIPVPAHHSVDGLDEMKEIYKEMKQGENWEGILRAAIVKMSTS